MLKRELEKLKQEKESNQLKIKNFDNASKSLDKLIGSQILDNSIKGLGYEHYHVVSPPPIGLFSPPKLDLSNSGIKEFKQPEFQSYGPKSCKIKSKNASEDIPNELKEYFDAPLVKDRVLDNKDCPVESPIVVEQKTDVPTIAKVKFVRPKQQEKLVRKPFKYTEIYRLRAVNTARPRAVNTARPNSTVVNAARANHVNAVKASACWVWRPTKPNGSSITGDMLPLEDEPMVEELLATTKVKTVNREEQIQALVDKKKVIITETSVRSDLYLEDAEGTECIPTATIFEQLTLIGAKTTTWNEFSGTIASVIIYLATNQKFNFSKYIFDHMVKNLEDRVKFLMFPRFVQVFLDSQVEGMLKHKEIYVIPSHTKKIFANMKRQGKDFSGKVTPLFETMLAQPPEDMGEGSEIPTDSHHTPTVTQPSTSSQPQQKQKSNKSKTKITEEDASKQGRMIVDLDADKGVALVDETQGRNDQDMFDTSIFDDEEVVAEKEVSTADPVTTVGEVVTTAGEVVATAGEIVTSAGVKVSTTTITYQISMDEITLAKALIDIKTSKPKANGIVVQEPSKTPTPTPIDSSQQSSKAKDKAKAKIIEPEKPLKRKDHIMIDEEVAINLEAQMQAELEEEERLAKQKEEETNIALIESWNNRQAIMDANYELAARLQEEERGELTIEENQGSEKAAEGSSKRAGDKLEQEDAKRQRIEEENESE
uniref:Synaptobrevin, longin-like domain protein n=1 Tax=Tanacetum cinerariifolium TaxID=118510 RepID=A0A699GP03_TANCI|nr:hypothetical protein [Tanacetum cinerariifolium]